MYVSNSTLVRQLLGEITDPETLKNILWVCSVLIDLKKFDKDTIAKLMSEVDVQAKFLPQSQQSFTVKVSDLQKSADVTANINASFWDATITSQALENDLGVIVSWSGFHFKKTLDADLKKIFGTA
jgi:hypothetical protein